MATRGSYYERSLMLMQRARIILKNIFVDETSHEKYKSLPFS